MPTGTRSTHPHVKPKASLPRENLYPGYTGANPIQQHTPPIEVDVPRRAVRKQPDTMSHHPHASTSALPPPPISLLCTPWTPSLSIGLASLPPLASSYPVPQPVRTPPYKQSHISIYDYLSKDELQWNESTTPSSSSLITSIHCQVPAIPGIDPHHLLPICDDLGDIQQCWHPDCMEQELFLDRDDVPALRWHFLGDVALHGEVREACDKNLPIPCIHSSEDGVHCGKEFVSAEWFLQHVQRHLAAPRATCPLCGVELESPGGIVEHYWNWPTTRCPVFWRMLRDGHGVEKVMLSESLGPGPPKGYPRWLS